MIMANSEDQGICYYFPYSYPPSGDIKRGILNSLLSSLVFQYSETILFCKSHRKWNDGLTNLLAKNEI